MIANASRITTRNDDMENVKSEQVPIYQKMTLTIRAA